MTPLGRYLAEVLEERGLTQKELAAATGLNDATIRKLQYGGNPTIGTILTVARYLGIPPERMVALYEGRDLNNEPPVDVDTYRRVLRELIDGQKLQEDISVLALRVMLALSDRNPPTPTAAADKHLP